MKFASEEHRAHVASALARGVRVTDSQGRELSLDDVMDGTIIRKPENATTTGPRNFAEAMAMEMKAGADAQEAIRLASKKYPALYRTYRHELRNPPMTGPKPEDLAPKPGDHATGESFGRAIRQAMRSGADDALDRAVEENPGAYRDYLRTLQPPEGC